MRNLEDLITWLEYGRTSGYIAAREPKAQEEHWADLLKKALNEKASLFDRLNKAIHWLRRLEEEYPGCINKDAIAKHLENPN